MNELKLIETDTFNVQNFGMCGLKNPKHEGYSQKKAWLKHRYFEGMRYKILFSETEGTVGGIEYLPGEYAWRPVEAFGYIFIHCIYLMLKKHRKKGYGSMLINDCINDAKRNNKYGVSVITRKGSWMAGKDIFLLNGFGVVDTFEPDYELLTLKFNKNYPNPKFNKKILSDVKKYSKGLTLFSSAQCPYTSKSIFDLQKISKEKYGMEINLIKIKNYIEAQKVPCPFGSFCLILNGKIIADHPISSKRFTGIMKIVETSFSK